MGDLQTDWVRERATSLTSGDPDLPLTADERAAVDRMVGDAGLVALGEATHGSGAIIQAIERVLGFLIRERRAGVVILEARFISAGIDSANAYLDLGDDEADEDGDGTTDLGYYASAQTAISGAISWQETVYSYPAANGWTTNPDYSRDGSEKASVCV
jgi:erythromycin esterase-like protein